MANSVAETVIGAVVLAAAVGFVVYAGQSRGLQLGGGESYPLKASFRSADGISVGTDVRVAGINVGSVSALDLDPATFQAKATFTVQGNLQIPDDSDVKIRRRACSAATSSRSPRARRTRCSRPATRSSTPRARSACSIF